MQPRSLPTQMRFLGLGPFSMVNGQETPGRSVLNQLQTHSGSGVHPRVLQARVSERHGNCQPNLHCQQGLLVLRGMVVWSPQASPCSRCMPPHPLHPPNIGDDGCQRWRMRTVQMLKMMFENEDTVYLFLLVRWTIPFEGKRRKYYHLQCRSTPPHAAAGCQNGVGGAGACPQALHTWPAPPPPPPPPQRPPPPPPTTT